MSYMYYKTKPYIKLLQSSRQEFTVRESTKMFPLGMLSANVLTLTTDLELELHR
jgi:hypothetical protein